MSIVTLELLPVADSSTRDAARTLIAEYLLQSLKFNECMFNFM